MIDDFQPFNTIEDWKSRGYHQRTPPLVLVGYDASGDGSDRDALVMVSREEHQKGEPYDPDFAVVMMFRVLMAHRMAQSLEFPDKLAYILRLNKNLHEWKGMARSSGHVFCVETNGVGHSMASTLRSKISTPVFDYTTVGNVSAAPFTSKKLSMPRTAALDNMRVLAETHMLKMAKDAPGGSDLTNEMVSFVWAGPMRPEAMQGHHDDLVMATCGALWIGSKVLPPLLKQQKFTPRGPRANVHGRGRLN